MSTPTQLQVGPSIVDWALQQVGKPYQWGGTGPGSFDCSGLTMESYKNGGNITIPRVASAQQAAGQTIDSGSLQPADLCFAGAVAYHVAMYIGNGQIVAADETGTPVRTRAFNVSEWTGGFRRMADIAGSVISSTTSDILSSLGPLFGVLEGVNAVASHLTSSAWWDRIGKGAIAFVLIMLGIVFINRRHIESAAKTGAKAAEVAAVAG